ncbi:uncharacterized protein LOC141906757 [Tubulanus polymorphus]|uniref:uncharacterized protein LOC141906757 n=1 Tax=Tubulanus polymorphus TaxID=672921 RepID=UPI003DA3F2A0
MSNRTHFVYAQLKFKADSKLHNGTTFRCLAKENPTDPEPALFDPIVVHNLATAWYYNVLIPSNAETKRLTCDPPANFRKQSNDKWIVSVPIVNSITTDYRGRCLLNGKRFIDIRRRDLGRYDEPGKNNVNTNHTNTNSVNAIGVNANGVNTNGGSGNGVNVAGGVFGGLIVFLLYNQLLCSEARKPAWQDEPSLSICACVMIPSFHAPSIAKPA